MSSDGIQRAAGRALVTAIQPPDAEFVGSDNPGPHSGAGGILVPAPRWS